MILLGCERNYFDVMIDIDAIRLRWDAVGSKLDERGQRLFAAAEVAAAGHGGLKAVNYRTHPLDDQSGGRRSRCGAIGERQGSSHWRRAQAGCRHRSGTGSRAPHLVEPATLGDPMRPLIWVSKSMDKLADTLTGWGIRSARTQLRFFTSVQPQGGRGFKAHGSECPVRVHQHQGYRGTGRRTAGDLRRHEEERADWQLQERWLRLPPEKRTPAGQRARLRRQRTGQRRALWCLHAANAGFVSVGITSDTAEFAVASIPVLVQAHGAPALSKGTRADDHGGRRRREIAPLHPDIRKPAPC